MLRNYLFSKKKKKKKKKTRSGGGGGGYKKTFEGYKILMILKIFKPKY
jgi:hypothetical protein